jgi:hypothetical protein
VVYAPSGVAAFSGWASGENLAVGVQFFLIKMDIFVFVF